MSVQFTIQGLCKRAAALVVGCFYGVLVACDLLLKTIKLGPGTVFAKKDRSKPLPCLEDPNLGTHGYAHLENIRMHYVSNGAENKPLMLLVHGFPEFWYSWRHQLREFKDSYRVVAVDLRGYGDSDKPSGKGSYAVPKLVNDLKQIVTALGYSRCVLVGHDWGGALVWAFGEMYPDMVSHLIIMNAPNGRAMQKLLMTSFSQFKMSWYMFFFQLPWLPEFMFRFNDFAALDFCMKLGKNGVRSDRLTDDDMEAYKYNFSRCGFNGPINFYRAAMSLTNLSRDMTRGTGVAGSGKGDITAPTLLIWGEEDTALDRSLPQLSAKVCKGKVTIKYVEGASHWVQMDRPDLVNKHMREFLAED
ncbi:epoxide hydrolase 4-like [Babylonia areolata]|uniref:epoxide hydrolase 4-like n=1 Tax=Babylonia areolata TaxID=304850 RepID=UPI003FD2790F